jgi:hypothetical protein
MVAEGLEATIALEKRCLREPQKPPPSRTSGIGLWWLRNSMVAEGLEATIALEKRCLREPQKPPPSRTSGIGLWWLRI